MRILSVALALALAGCAQPVSTSPAPNTAASTSAAPPAKTGGCRLVTTTLHLYTANEASTEVVVVDVDPSAIGLKKGARKTVDLSQAHAGVKVWLDVYASPARVENVHCTKTPTEAQMAERYAAATGTLTIELAEDGTVTASVEGATFALEGRPRIEVAGRRFDHVSVARSAS